MEREDGRKLSPQAQYERRKQAVRMHKQGKSYAEIDAALSMSHVTARYWVKVAAEKGLSALKPAQRGRKKGHGRKLSEEQEAHLKKQICAYRPEQLKFGFALWTRGAVHDLIEQDYGLDLPIRTIGEYLKRWGFTPQRPMVKAYEQKPEAVKAWLEVEYPKIAARAEVEDAQIHWGDETALVNTDVRGRGYQPKGQTPIAYAVGGTRQKLSMISTVTNQGKTRWMIIDGNFDTEKCIVFLGALIKDSPKKTFLIVDNLRVHHSKVVKEWVEMHKDSIELFYLPSYSPELNPDERLNADLKYAIASKVAVRSKDKLKDAANEHMTMLDNTPERVMSYFEDKRIKYAA